jgi:hypothetical protein
MELQQKDHDKSSTLYHVSTKSSVQSGHTASPHRASKARLKKELSGPKRNVSFSVPNLIHLNERMAQSPPRASYISHNAMVQPREVETSDEDIAFDDMIESDEELTSFKSLDATDPTASPLSFSAERHRRMHSPRYAPTVFPLDCAQAIVATY